MLNHTQSDDIALVERARTDSEAYSTLYRRYLTPLYRYIFRRLGNFHDAEDITAQVFTEALEGLVAGRYHQDGCFVAWLFTIARRRVADFYRRGFSTQLDDPSSTEPGLLAVIEKSEDLLRLASMLDQLDEERQELLRLRFSAGLSFLEIGMIDGRSEAAVKMAIYRTIEYLRDHWEVENG